MTRKMEGRLEKDGDGTSVYIRAAWRDAHETLKIGCPHLAGAGSAHRNTKPETAFTLHQGFSMRWVFEPALLVRLRLGQDTPTAPRVCPS